MVPIQAHRLANFEISVYINNYILLLLKNKRALKIRLFPKIQKIRLFKITGCFKGQLFPQHKVHVDFPASPKRKHYLQSPYALYFTKALQNTFNMREKSWILFFTSSF